MDKIAVVIPAAGQGKRMGLPYNKQFARIKDLPVVFRTILVFMRSEVVSSIIVICASGEEDLFSKEELNKFGITDEIIVVTGGAERQDSVYRGLLAVPADCNYVMVHDGARPLVCDKIIKEAAEQVKLHKAIVVGVPVKDTVKLTDDRGFITETLPRERLWQIQTPQAFETKILRDAYEKAFSENFYGTDDASLVERLGHSVKIIKGLYENFKITTPEDLVLAEAILQRREHS